MKEGDEIDAFVYFDSEDRIVASAVFPKAMLDEFGCFEVVDVTSFGAFVDWGLPKDLLVPRALQKFPFKVGMKVVLRVCLDDETGRIIGSQKYNDLLSKDFKALKTNQEVKLLVRERTPLGFKVIVNNLYDGMIFHNEIFEAIEVGDEKYNDFNGYCQGLHFLESNRKKRVSIDDVKIDDLNCVKSIHVTQSYIEK
jgi:predicted RNA-binding protein (virulence factor B family)